MFRLLVISFATIFFTLVTATERLNFMLMSRLNSPVYIKVHAFGFIKDYKQDVCLFYSFRIIGSANRADQLLSILCVDSEIWFSMCYRSHKLYNACTLSF